MAKLEIRGLSVSYGEVRALTDVNVTVEEGETVTVIGANGAGKSTLMMSIMGFNRHMRGEVIYDGKSLKNLPPSKIANMGLSLVPEGREVFPSLTVAENLRLGLKARIRKTKPRDWDARLERLNELFPRLKERSWQQAGTLSGGEQQMLVMARALASDPDILLLDEPSLGLAPVLVGEVFETLAALKRAGTTIVLVEQLAHKALELADRAYVLETGKVTTSGSARELLDDPQVVQAYLGA